MSAQRARIRFRTLESAEMEAILARNHVGRIAFSFHDRVDLEPIHYVFHRGTILCRTAPGTKLTTLAHHPWVAFEVDETHDLFDWQSVVVRGSIYLLDEQGAEADVRAREEAIAQMRELLPEIFTPDDPAPFRQVILRLFPAEMTGRAASPSSARGSP
ncbi:MAG TPA: pyridoxamine 5'-phosphate oxidase family protein [Gemmatimonadales bacterium]|nr:pyridoxamine 5'-phosphate oxidase family protein [Gemmatimonadales bacterium]